MSVRKWTFVEAENCLVRGSETSRLTPRAGAVLSCFLRHPGVIITRERLLEEVWLGVHVNPDLVREYVFDLRRALGDDARNPSYIETVRGKGFRLLGGVELLPDPAVAPSDAEPVSQAAPEVTLKEGEYKEVTTLYCAFTEPRAAAARSEEEAAYRLMEQALRLAQNIVERHDGVVLQRLEYGFLSIFGAPRSVEDHARRAILAALQLIDALNGSGDGEVSIDRGEVAGSASIGIASGPALVGALAAGDELYTAGGRTTAMAKRLQALARPGEIVLSETTFGHVGSEIRAVLRPDSEDGLQAFTLRGLDALRSGVPRRAAGGNAEFVGRREEIGLLRERFFRARAGQAQFLNIIGPPGIGKSRIVEEFRSSTGGDVVFLEGRSFSHEVSTPYTPLRDMLRKLLDSGRSDAEAACPAGLAMTPAQLLALLEPHANGDAPKDRQKSRRADIFRAITETMIAIALERVLVLVFEDVHWMDATSAQWLSEFIPMAADSRVFVIATSRTPPNVPLPPDAAVTHLVLPILVPGDSAALVRSVLQDPEVPQAVIDEVVSRSGGNPFFLIELSLAVLDSGSFRSAAVLPDNVQTLVLSRVDQLDSIGKAILRICSVIGDEIPRSLLEGACGMDGSALDARLDDLVQSGFLSRHGVGAETHFRFRHALMEVAIYQSLPLAALKEVHARIVETLEEKLPHLPEMRPEVAARHHEHASNPERAVSYLYRAARRAYERSAHVEAGQYARKALSLLDALPDRARHADQELDLLLVLAPSLAASLGYGSAALKPVFDRAAELCEGLEGEEAWFKVNVGVWNYNWVRGELDAARETASRLVANAGRRPHYLPRARAALAEILFHAGRPVEAFRHLEESVADYKATAAQRLSIRIPHVSCLCYAAWTAWHLGRPTASAAFAADAARNAASLEHPFSHVLCHALLAELHQFRLEIAACRSEAQRAIAVSREHRFPFWEGTAMVNLGWAMSREGDFERGQRMMRDGIQIFTDTGAQIQMSCWTGMMAEVHVEAGQLDEALALVDAALGWVARTGEMHYLSELHRIRGAALRRREGVYSEAALAAYRDAIDVAAEQGAVMRELRAVCGIAEMLADTGQSGAARTLVDGVIGRLPEQKAGADLRAAQALLARL